MMGFTPTEEQQAALDAFRAGDSITLTAGAGTGKTATLRLLSEAAGRRRGLYAAFNRAIADDAEGSFPKSVTVKTTHKLAFAGGGHRFQARLKESRVPPQEMARRLSIQGVIRVGDSTLIRPAQQARMAVEMARRFCLSADIEPSVKHLPATPGIDPSARADVADLVLPYAQRVWHDWQDPNGSLVRYDSAAYVKSFCLSQPRLGYDFLLFDEAQDTSPVIAALVADQQAHGTQLVVVGDSAQSINGWNGAINSMSMFDTDQSLMLSQSFRFGPAIAQEANKWLERIDTPLRLKGTSSIVSIVADQPIPEPDVVLCRTNAGTIAEVMAAHLEQQKVAIVGGGGDARRLAEAADALQQGRSTSHQELALFPTWGAVQDYVDDGNAPDLRPFVRLIDTYGPAAIISAIDQTVPEKNAARIVSTAHKAKGREWPRVQVHDDFPEPRTNGETGEEEAPGVEEAMLAYVTVTRAKETLSRGPLVWIDKHRGHPGQRANTQVRPRGNRPGSNRPATATSHVATSRAAVSVLAPDTVDLILALDQDLMDWLNAEAALRSTTAEELVERLIRHRRDWAG